MEEIFRSILVLTIILYFIYIFLFEIVIMTAIILFCGAIALIVTKGNVILAAICLALAFFCAQIQLVASWHKDEIETNFHGFFVKLGIPIIVICFYSFGLHRVI